MEAAGQASSGVLMWSAMAFQSKVNLSTQALYSRAVMDLAEDRFAAVIKPGDEWSEARRPPEWGLMETTVSNDPRRVFAWVGGDGQTLVARDRDRFWFGWTVCEIDRDLVAIPRMISFQHEYGAAFYFRMSGPDHAPEPVHQVIPQDLPERVFLQLFGHKQIVLVRSDEMIPIGQTYSLKSELHAIGQTLAQGFASKVADLLL